MNKIVRVAFSCLLMTSSLLYAEGVRWRCWETATNEAEIVNKIIMVKVVRDNCHYCTDMQAAVFDDEEMAAYIERRFVPATINVSHRSLPSQMSVSITPSFFFFTPDKKLIKMIPGAWGKTDFRAFLEKISLE